MTPEQQARQRIDSKLIACGWAIKDCAKSNLAAVVGKFGGIALREIPLKCNSH